MIDRLVIRAMRLYGGSFVQALADAYLHADEDNARRIREAWPEYWAQYTDHAERLRQREQEETLDLPAPASAPSERTP